MIKKTDWNIKIDNTTIGFDERLFKSRELTKEDIDLSINNVHDYIDINDIDVAAFEISTAVKNKKRILIIGDYDVDGTISTTMGIKFFYSINYPVDYYIPDRLKEGYGISHSLADKIVAEKKYDLIITVDNGIAAIDQIKKITDAGIKVIVTDHHECKEVLPNACAVIDCKRPDNTYPFRDMCGAGVVLKLICALSDEFGLPDNTWEEYLEYAAIATVADVMPLVDENRIFVKEGIERIKKTNKPSILNLLRVADKLDNINDLTSLDIAFYIAPLINASSRVGSVETVMNLLLTESSEEAIIYSDKLKELNEKRKEIESQILKEANTFLIKNYDFTSINPIVVYGNNWHIGVIGIVASRLEELYSKPVIILSKTDDGLYHGSCRTHGDINIIKMLDSVKEYIKEYGGHEGAAGLKVEQHNLENFINALNNYANKNFSQNMFIPVINADISININEIDLNNYNYINTFAPFGNGNTEPKFVLKNVRITSLRKIGQKEGFENAHFKITVADVKDTLAKNVVEGIGFFNSDYVDILNIGDIVDILFKPSINEWQGNKIPQMLIQDIHCDVYQKEGVSTEENIMYLEDGIEISEMSEEFMLDINEYIPSYNECFEVFKALCSIIGKQPNGIVITDLDILSLIVSATLNRTYKNSSYISPFKLARIIEINQEAGYFYYKKMLFGKIVLALTDGQNLKKVSSTNIFKKLNEERSFSDND